MTYPLVPLRRFARMYYGDALATDEREDGDIPVMGSNGPFDKHDTANMRGPCIIIGRKGSHGKITWCDSPAWVTDTAFGIDERHTDADLRWLYYAIQTARLDQTSLDTGVPGLAREFAYEQKMPLAPTHEQRAIAAFLDTETARIDALIAKKDRLLQRLGERLRVARTLSVLGGERGQLVPHRALGAVHPQWKTARLKHVVPRIGVGVVVNPSDYVSDVGVPFLRGSDVLEGRISLDSAQRISEENSRALWRSRLEEGDVLVVRAGDPGRAAVVPEELSGANCASVLILKRGEVLRPDFLAAFMNSSAARRQVDAARYGAAQEQINVGHIVDFIVPVPSIAEQDAVLERLREQERTQTKLVGSLKRQVALLGEHRQALITAAVTGELEVPGVAA